MAVAKKKGGRGVLRTVLELSLFAIWLLVTALAGYFIGTRSGPVCEQMNDAQINTLKNADISVLPECTDSSDGEDLNGLSFESIRNLWTCKSVGNASAYNRRILPQDGKLGSTKWESILSVDPNKFFNMYLTQYPGDTRAVQPVIIFSHKPLDKLEDAPEICKVLDIAIVPDTPGVCVAVTETYHDVASYHMLHADRKSDGTFSLTSNYLEGRNLPSDDQYAQARSILAEYFTNADYVVEQVREISSYSRGATLIGCLVDSLQDLTLFENSLKYSLRAGNSANSIVAFTTSSVVLVKLKNLGVRVISLINLSEFGSLVGPVMRRFFLQAWLAFAVADSLVRMLWQSPGTIWLSSLSSVLNKEPMVELLWAFKGRKDKRSAPFFVSFDFFVPSGSERPVHLMHELMLHFDLVLAWNSLDAVASYRLSENNARYGTTTKVFTPLSVLHVEMLGRDVSKIVAAVSGQGRPDVVVFPTEEIDTEKLIVLLKAAGLWDV